MKQLPASKIFGDLERRARRLENLSLEGLKLRAQGRLTVGSLDALFESSLLNLYTAFELFVEDLFYSALLDQSGLPNTTGLVTFTDRSQAEMVLLGGRDYLKWLPYGDGVRNLAARLLYQGRPFHRLDRHTYELDMLEEIRRVRNAIAHESASAQGKIGTLTAGLRPRRRHPAGLLQSVQQGSTSLSIYTRSVLQIARALANSDETAAQNGLSPERPYDRSGYAPRGLYECTTCRKRHRITRATAALPSCSACASSHARGGWQRIYV